MKEDIQAWNKLIAEFMGFTYKDNRFINEYRYKDDNGDIHEAGFSFKDPKYHTSWDWLMPVVEKIESLKLKYKMTVSIVGNSCQIISDNHNLMAAEVTLYSDNRYNKIERTRQAIIQFIQWYNLQPKPDKP